MIFRRYSWVGLPPPLKLLRNITPVLKAEKYLCAHILYYKCILNWSLSTDSHCCPLFEECLVKQHKICLWTVIPELQNIRTHCVCMCVKVIYVATRRKTRFYMKIFFLFLLRCCCCCCCLEDSVAWRICCHFFIWTVWDRSSLWRNLILCHGWACIDVGLLRNLRISDRRYSA